MNDRWCFRLTVLGIFGLFLVMMFISLGVYLTSSTNFVQTDCLIYNTSVVPDVCTYECNCHLSGKITVCSTCYKGCFNEVIYVSYDSNYTSSIMLGTTYQFNAAVLTLSNYPVGSSRTCYYDPGNPNTVQLQPNSLSSVWQTILIVMAVMAGFTLLIGGSIDLLLYCGCYVY
jgi:hypothetical protein